VFSSLQATSKWLIKARPRLAAALVQELQDAGVEADVWKIEGLDRREDCERVVAAAHRGGVGCITLGRGEDDAKVREWLTIAAGVSGFIGLAVGRTGAARQLPGRQDNTRGCRGGDGEPVPGVCGHF